MAPYVSLLEPELRAGLADPLPEVRATAAKALGSLLRGMGPSHFQTLLPWLLDRLKSEVLSLFPPRYCPSCPRGKVPLPSEVPSLFPRLSYFPPSPPVGMGKRQIPVLIGETI
jgi:hypothetical protein